MFRVPRRTNAPPVVAPPDRPTWHGTLTARLESEPSHAAPASSVAVSDRLRVAPWESIPAPWGEPEQRVPYVVITTQPWPEEWWRPNARRLPPEGDTVAELPELRPAPGHSNGNSNGAGRAQRDVGGMQEAASAPEIRSRTGAIPVHGDAGSTSHDDSSEAALLHEDRARRREIHLEAVGDVRTQRRLERERKAEARARRRGMLTRVAIFVAGLVISLIAVETASRRRS